MAAYPKTGSILGSTTHTSLSTQLIIMVNNEPVGAIQRMSVKEQRGNKRIGEVGLDGTVELVPNERADYTLDVERIYFDGLSLPEAFSRGFTNISSQRISFDIIVIDQNSGTGDDAIITTYKGCWFNSLDITYEADDYVLAQSASIDVEDVFVMRGGEAVVKSQGLGGGRQIAGAQIDEAEIAADVGLRRGALDFPGLISATF